MKNMREIINVVETVLLEAQYYFGGFATMPSHSEVSKYMRGWCPYFALALHRLYGYTIVGMGAHFTTQRPDGMFVDIRGVMTEQQVQDGLGGAHMVPYQEEDIMLEFETGEYKCGFFSPNDLKKAERLAKKLIG